MTSKLPTPADKDDFEVLPEDLPPETALGDMDPDLRLKYLPIEQANRGQYNKMADAARKAGQPTKAPGMDKLGPQAGVTPAGVSPGYSDVSGGGNMRMMQRAPSRPMPKSQMQPMPGPQMPNLVGLMQMMQQGGGGQPPAPGSPLGMPPRNKYLAGLMEG